MASVVSLVMFDWFATRYKCNCWRSSWSICICKFSPSVVNIPNAHSFGINALWQFDDFENKWAFKLLQRYRNFYRCFNDDVHVISFPIIFVYEFTCDYVVYKCIWISFHPFNCLMVDWKELLLHGFLSLWKTVVGIWNLCSKILTGLASFLFSSLRKKHVFANSQKMWICCAWLNWYKDFFLL